MMDNFAWNKTEMFLFIFRRCYPAESAQYCFNVKDHIATFNLVTSFQNINTIGRHLGEDWTDNRV